MKLGIVEKVGACLACSSPSFIPSTSSGSLGPTRSDWARSKPWAHAGVAQDPEEKNKACLEIKALETVVSRFILQKSTVDCNLGDWSGSWPCKQQLWETKPQLLSYHMSIYSVFKLDVWRTYLFLIEQWDTCYKIVHDWTSVIQYSNIYPSSVYISFHKCPQLPSHSPHHTSACLCYILSPAPRLLSSIL